MNANLRNFALWVIIVLLLLALFTLFQNPGQRTQSQEDRRYKKVEFAQDVLGANEDDTQG